MRPFKTKMMAGATLSLTLSAGLLAGITPDAALAAPGKAAQRMTVVVDGSGYKPATINVKAGRPVQLTFQSKGNSCANMVKIPALGKHWPRKMARKRLLPSYRKRERRLPSPIR